MCCVLFFPHISFSTVLRINEFGQSSFFVTDTSGNKRRNRSTSVTVLLVLWLEAAQPRTTRGSVCSLAFHGCLRLVGPKSVFCPTACPTDSIRKSRAVQSRTRSIATSRPAVVRRASWHSVHSNTLAPPMATRDGQESHQCCSDSTQ